MAAANPGLTIHLLASQPRGQTPPTRLNAADIARHIDPQSARIFLCASKRLLDHLIPALTASGAASERIHHERFGLTIATPSDAPRQVVCNGQAFTFDSQPTLLDALEQHGFAPRADCRAGHCGVCRVSIVQGRVRQLIPTGVAGLRPHEALACCCVPDSDVMMSV